MMKFDLEAVTYRVLGAVMFSFLAGCATTSVTVQISSEPSGAYIYSDGQAQGIAPVRLTYLVSDAARKAGVFLTTPVQAVWVSGAKAQIPLQISVGGGSSQHYTFNRPANIGGLRQDLEFALQVEQVESERRAAAAAAASRLVEQGLELANPRGRERYLSCTPGGFGTYSCK